MSRSPGRWNSAWDENRQEKKAEEISAPQKRPRMFCVIFLYTPHHILKNKKVLKKIDFFFLQVNLAQKSSWSPKREVLCLPEQYTHHRESGNNTFQNMVKTLPGQKTRLPGPDGPGNLINRKIRFFYIETMSKFFSQLRKKITFFSRSKKFSKKHSAKKITKKIPEKSEFFSDFEI